MKVILTIAAAAAAFAAPAYADPKPIEPAAASADAPVAAGGEATSSKAVAGTPRRYCYDMETTGSRILQQSCRTREEWKRAGVVVPKGI